MMIGSTIRQMMVPALVPKEYVTSLFSNLGQEFDESERNELFGIFKYFNDYYINRIPIWNCFNIPERERIIFAKLTKKEDSFLVITRIHIFTRYNNRFKIRVNKKHPNIWVFIDAIQKEVYTVHNLIFQISIAMKPLAKQPKYTIVEQCMKKLYERLSNKEIHLQQLLKQLFFVANGK